MEGELLVKDFKTNLINSYNHSLNKDSIKSMLLIGQINALLNDTLCCYRSRAVLNFQSDGSEFEEIILDNT